MGKDNSDLPIDENHQWSEDYTNWPLQSARIDDNDIAGDQRPRQPGFLRNHEPGGSVTPDKAEFVQDQDAASTDMPDKTGTGQTSESDLVELRSVADNFLATFNTALSELDSSRQQIAERSNRITELNLAIEEISTELHTQVESAREQQEAHTCETAELNARIQELDEQRGAALQQVEDLQQQVETHAREAGELGGQIDKLTCELDTQSQENREQQEAHTRETAELNAGIQELTSSLQHTRTQCQELEEHSAKIEKLNNTLHETSLSEANLYRKQIEARNREVEELGKQLEKLRAERRQTGNNPPRNDVDSQAIDSLQRRIEELTAALEQSEARSQVSAAADRDTPDHTSRLDALTSALMLSERALHQVDESASDPVTYFRDGKPVYANPGYLHLFGEGNSGIPELRDFVREDETESFNRLLAGEDAAPNMGEAPVFNLVLPAGDTLTVELRATQATFGGDPCSRLTLRPQGKATDPDNPREEPGKLDLLTGLYNREHFLEVLGERIMQESTEQEHQAVMYVLLDNFMLIRNEAGILDSEHVLKEIGELLRSHCNESDVVARFGDCTFTILYRCDSAENITTRAEQVRKLVEDQIAVVGGQSILTTASVGVCLINEYTHNANDIITRADLACEVARTSGGNQVHIHSTIIDEQVCQGNEENWDKVIRDTLEQQRLHLAYQPIISLGDEPGQRYEVLLRILDAENKIILPGQFISVAENIGLSVDIDRYVVESAFKTIAENENSDVMLFIKVSNPSIADSGFPAWIRQKQKEYRLGESRVVFEIPENILGKDLKNAALFTKALHDMGCMVAIEHYTCQTQPQHLKHVHADFLKIDGSLISELDKNNEHRTRAAAIVDLARLNQMNTVAERVEDAGSLALLWDLGINYAQGNFIQEPCQQLNYDFVGETVSEEDNQGKAIYTIN